MDPNIDKLIEYINWLSKRHPMKTESLGQCLEKLQGVYETIGAVPNKLFDEWGISPGIKLLVTTFGGKWEREKAQGRT